MQIVNYIKDTAMECAPFTWGITLFCYGCNLQCEMCKGYNYETVHNKDLIKGSAIDIIRENVTPLHDCVVFCGGEPTIWGNKLIEALQYCKEHGLHTKVFTNGTQPHIVKEMNKLKLVDAYSVDVKGIPEKIASEIGMSAREYIRNLKQTLRNIISNDIPLEMRTTFYSANEEDREDIENFMCKLIQDCKRIKGKEYFIKWIPQNDYRKYIK